MKNDRTFLERAIAMAGKGIDEGRGPFGAVVTKNGKVIAEAHNEVVLSHDPTAHAEILAIRKAGALLKTHDLSDCVIYTSCEPCPMCLGAIYWAGIRKVVYASDRSDASAAGFNDSLIYNEIKLDPEERIIAFNKLPGLDGKEVFRKWNDYNDKIPY